MPPPHLLSVLRCPFSGQVLEVAGQELIDSLNRAIQQRRLRTRIGVELSEPLDGGLVDKQQKYLFPVRDGIVTILDTEVIELDQLQHQP